MASPKNVISSTENLLSLIRGKHKAKQKAPKAELSSSTLKSGKRPKATVFALQKALTVGVDISYDRLKLIKIRQLSNNKQVIIDYRQLPFEAGLPIESAQFSKFFKSSLKSFCGAGKKVQIWGIAPSARVEMRYLRIPKVPKKQIANAAYWTYKKEVNFDEAEMFFDFQVLGDIVEGAATKTEILVYTSPREEVNRIMGLFGRSGITPTGITVAPFATQNLFRCGWVADAAANVCSLYIGHDWSRIDIFANHNLIMTRGIKTGINSMIEAIREEVLDLNDDDGKGIFMEPIIEDETPADPVDNDAQKDIPFTMDASDKAEKLFFGLAEKAFDAETATGIKFSSDDVFEMVLPALERLVRQVERTLGHYTANFKKPAVTKIYLSGGICGHERIVDYIYGQLGLTGNIIDPFDKIETVAADVAPPDTLALRNGFVPAVGLALSNNSLTPNFIHTYQDKERTAKHQQINKAVLMAFMALMLICLGAYWQMGRQVANKKVHVAQLQKEIARYTPRIDQNMILKLAADTKRHDRALKASSKRYISVAVISEIARLTPIKIHLLRINTDFGSIIPAKAEKAAIQKVVIEGIITSSAKVHKSDLAAYLVQLKSSLLFDGLSVEQTTTEYYYRKPVLRFVANMQLASGKKGKNA